MYINAQSFRRWWQIFHSEESPLVELRLLGKSGGKTASGYFKDCEMALSALQEYWDGTKGIYAPINVINDACYSRTQHDVLDDKAKSTTGDNNINGRTWVMIDIDPERPADTNSTDTELAMARDVMRNVGVFLRDQGFRSPVIAMSGNGYHLYYRVNIACDEERDKIIVNFLKVLDMQFGTSECKIDTAVANRSRIAKVIGSRSNKGSDTKDRPQRESFFVKVPDVIEATDIAYFRKIAAMLPEEERPSRFNNWSREAFDLDSFITKHGIRVAKIQAFGDGQRYILEECPFCPDHRAPDAALFRMRSGAIGFRCLHNSCSHNTWHDLRLKYDPNAYTKRDYDDYKSRQTYYSTEVKEPPKPIPENEANGKKWLSMVDIRYVDPSTFVYIPTGFEELDSRMGGLCLGDVSVMTGRPGSGKTTMLDTMALNAIQRGYKVAVWSGELQESRFQMWMDQVAAGVQGVEKYKEWYICRRDVAPKIHSWLDGKLWLRNNSYKNRWSQLKEDITECVKTNGTQLVILDNLASMNLDSIEGQKNDRQSAFIAELKDYAKETNIHIIIVIHPRKDIGNGLMRLESISGAADLYGLCDNVFLLHRVCEDFSRRGKDFWGKEKVDSLMVYQEVIEVAKNRSHGLLDDLFGLYYEKETRRFKNHAAESIIYGWAEDETPPREAHYNQESRELPPDPLAFPQELSLDEVPF